MYYITAKVKYNWESDYSTKYLTSASSAFGGAEWSLNRIDLYTLETAKRLLNTMSERWCYYFLADTCSDYRNGKIIIDSIEIKEFKD